ncbi:hypothetical protein ACVIW2_009418 [Bradyrhizobium huanghuaihaiense]
MLSPQRWRGFGRRLHIGRKLEPNAGCAERLAIAVDEQPLVRCTRLSLQQRFQQQHGFRPEWTDAFLAALADKANATWALEPDRLGTQIESLLYPCPAVVEEREQRMIAHAFERGAVWPGKDRCHLRRVQITGFRYRCPLDRDMKDFHALSDRCGVFGRDEVEEAADRGKPAVARADRAAAIPRLYPLLRVDRRRSGSS